MSIFSKKRNFKNSNYDLHTTEELKAISNTHKQDMSSIEDTLNATPPFVPNKISTIELMCSHCGGTMTVDEDREILSCPYCGCKNLIPTSDKVRIQKIKSRTYQDIEFNRQETYRNIEIRKQEIQREIELNKHNSEIEVEKIKQKYKAQKETSGDRAIIILIVIMLLSSIFFFFLQDIENGIAAYKHPGELQVSYSVEECLESNKSDLYTLFKTDGFSNIKTIGLEDLKTGWITKEFSIEKVTVNGNSTFDSGDYFPKDAEVKIYYHSFKNKD